MLCIKHNYSSKTKMPICFLQVGKIACFCRLIEELKGIHWLPQDVSKMYTLVDFQMALNDKNQESQGLLEKFLLYRAMILSKVCFISNTDSM